MDYKYYILLQDLDLKLLGPEADTRMCSVKKVFLKILQNSQKNTCARVSFLNKVACLRPFFQRTPLMAASLGLRIWILIVIYGWGLENTWTTNLDYDYLAFTGFGLGNTRTVI